MITQCCNVTVTLQFNVIKIGCNILCMKPNIYDTNVEGIDSKENDLQRHISKVLVFTSVLYQGLE